MKPGVELHVRSESSSTRELGFDSGVQQVVGFNGLTSGHGRSDQLQHQEVTNPIGLQQSEQTVRSSPSVERMVQAEFQRQVSDDKPECTAPAPDTATEDSPPHNVQEIQMLDSLKRMAHAKVVQDYFHLAKEERPPMSLCSLKKKVSETFEELLVQFKETGTVPYVVFFDAPDAPVPILDDDDSIPWRLDTAPTPAVRFGLDPNSGGGSAKVSMSVSICKTFLCRILCVCFVHVHESPK